MIINDQEYEIRFDGAHCDNDSDLICCPEVREKVPGRLLARRSPAERPFQRPGPLSL